MFDIDEATKKFIMIIGSGLLGYTKMIDHKTHDIYIPPTKEEVIWQYQNIPLFNRTVDTIVSHLRQIFLTSGSSRAGGTCACSEPDIRNRYGIDLCSKCGLPLPD